MPEPLLADESPLSLAGAAANARPLLGTIGTQILTYIHGTDERADNNPRVGDLCLIHGETAPPSKWWSFARLTKLHSRDDGQVRVVTLKTAATTL